MLILEKYNFLCIKLSTTPENNKQLDSYYYLLPDVVFNMRIEILKILIKNYALGYLLKY